MGSPELTPQALSEIKMWLWIAGGLSVLVWAPFIASWWFERKNRVMRTAYEYWCPTCRKGTPRDEDKTCPECLNGADDGRA